MDYSLLTLLFLVFGVVVGTTVVSAVGVVLILKMIVPSSGDRGVRRH